MTVFEAHPAATEVVIASLPSGSVLRVHHPDVGVREYRSAYSGLSSAVVVPGDCGLLGWGCRDNQYIDLHAVRLRRDKRDRPAWHLAVQLLDVDHGFVYLEHEWQESHGGERWTATGVRTIPGSDPAYRRAALDAPAPKIRWVGETSAEISPVVFAYLDRCSQCRGKIFGLSEGWIRVSLSVSGLWHRESFSPLPATPEVCPCCGQDPRPMRRGGWIEGAGTRISGSSSDAVVEVKFEIRRRRPALARVADDEEAAQAYLG
uniref:hypothetical protein n=1 Tax=Nonomuraea sp. CA-251285 TaxID=3240002 RepID=UPI003F4981D8